MGTLLISENITITNYELRHRGPLGKIAPGPLPFNPAKMQVLNSYCFKTMTFLTVGLYNQWLL